MFHEDFCQETVSFIVKLLKIYIVNNFHGIMPLIIIIIIIII